MSISRLAPSLGGKPLASFINTLLSMSFSRLDEDVKNIYKEFLREIKNFYENEGNPTHSFYLMEEARSIDRFKCSVCAQNLKCETNYVSIEIPVPPKVRGFRVSCCEKASCQKEITEYQQVLHSTLGPFPVSSLYKDFGFIKLSSSGIEWKIEDIIIGLSTEKRLEVQARVVFDANDKTEEFPLTKIIEFNPDKKWEEILNLLPDSIGGEFIKEILRN